jgi:membrane fusion protein (multidrug efflux system)
MLFDLCFQVFHDFRKRDNDEPSNIKKNMNSNNHDSHEEIATSNVETRGNLTAAETPTDLRRPKSNGDENIPTGSPPNNKGAATKRLHGTVAAITALIVAVAAGVYYFAFIVPFESTDDAFIEAHVPAVAPQISGRVAQLLVQDNQEVKEGDLLLEIDARDYEAKLSQAQADLAAARSQLAQAKAQFAVDEAKAEEEHANLAAVEAQAAYAETNLARLQAIGDYGVSQNQIDVGQTQLRSTAADVQVEFNKIRAAEAQAALSKASIVTAEANVEQSQAAMQQAELNLSYTKITAPETGYVTHRTVEQGAYVQPGQALLAIVPHQIWVVGNFKETQLTHMHPGQPVTVHVDAYPHLKFTGHVDSIQSGSGAQFSLFPPENATGNYVKVVQRVPVKIVLDEVSGANIVLGPGMSVEPKVRVK